MLRRAWEQHRGTICRGVNWERCAGAGGAGGPGRVCMLLPPFIDRPHVLAGSDSTCHLPRLLWQAQPG